MNNKNIIRLLFLASLWGPSFLFIKIAIHDIPPLTLVAFRLTLAAIMLYGVLRLRGIPLPRGWRAWRKFIFIGFFANALPFTLFSVGEQFTDSGIAAILNGATPIFTVIIAHFFIHDEKLSLSRLSGVIVGFGGILLIFQTIVPNRREFLTLLRGEGLYGGAETWGLVAFVGAAGCYGISIVYGRVKLRGLPPLVGPTAQLICSSLMMVPVALIVERPFNLAPGAPSLLSALVLAIFGTAIAYLVYYQLVDHASATFLSLVTYIIPPIGVILGVIFLNERLGWNMLAGLGLIILGVMIVNGVLARLESPEKMV